MFREVKWSAQGNSASKIKLRPSDGRACDFSAVTVLPNLPSLRVLHETKFTGFNLVSSQPPEHEIGLNVNRDLHLMFEWSCEVWYGPEGWMWVQGHLQIWGSLLVGSLVVLGLEQSRIYKSVSGCSCILSRSMVGTEGLQLGWASQVAGYLDRPAKPLLGWAVAPSTGRKWPKARSKNIKYRLPGSWP